MPQAIHRNNGTTPAANRPTGALLSFARPDIPPSERAAFARPDIPPSTPPTPSRREAMIFSVNEDYKLLFQLMFQAIGFFDRCDDCETLIDAGKMFQYLGELAEDALEEVWEAS